MTKHHAITSDFSRAKDVDLARRLTALTMGIDRLERNISADNGVLDSEGLVPIYLGAELVPPSEFKDWDEVFLQLEPLEAEAKSYPEGSRKVFLLNMFDSLRCATDLFRGENLDFSEKLTRLVGVPAAAVAPDQLESMQAKLSARLEQVGYREGSLAARVRRWESDRFVDPHTIATTFNALMLEGQRRTDAMIYPTQDYQMVLNPVRGVPYTARCSFDAGKMDLNLDLQFSHSALKHLVAHEVFPGHSTQLLYTKELATQGQNTPDVLLCTANTVVGAIQEGIGDQGIHLIDWVDSEDDAIYLDLRRLRSASATSAAWYQMGEGWRLDRVREFLENTCFPQAAWLEGRLRFAAHPFRGAFIASYWYGDEVVREVRERTLPAQHKQFIEFLYGSLNSVASLRMFEAGA